MQESKQMATPRSEVVKKESFVAAVRFIAAFDVKQDSVWVNATLCVSCAGDIYVTKAGGALRVYGVQASSENLPPGVAAAPDLWGFDGQFRGGSKYTGDVNGISEMLARTFGGFPPGDVQIVCNVQNVPPYQRELAAMACGRGCWQEASLRFVDRACGRQDRVRTLRAPWTEEEGANALGDFRFDGTCALETRTTLKHMCAYSLMRNARKRSLLSALTDVDAARLCCKPTSI
jgi:hypothetical protein